jgi:hypothetical protein
MGVAEVPVRIIRDSSEFGKLRSGGVSVAPHTNRAWIQHFQRAAAVVVNSGGQRHTQPLWHAQLPSDEGAGSLKDLLRHSRRLVHARFSKRVFTHCVTSYPRNYPTWRLASRPSPPPQRGSHALPRRFEYRPPAWPVAPAPRRPRPPCAR